VQSDYKEVLGSTEQYRTVVEFRDASLLGYELQSRGNELSQVFGVGSWQNNGKKWQERN
jgi:hypothetical protein